MARGNYGICDFLVKNPDVDPSRMALTYISRQPMAAGIPAGWWAYKHENGVHWFQWSDQNDLPSKEEMAANEKDGWYTPYLAPDKNG